MDTDTQACEMDVGVVWEQALYGVPLLSKAEERELFAAYRVMRGTPETNPAKKVLRDQLHAANMRLVRSIAEHYWKQISRKVRSSLDMDDLIDEGATGLMVAIEKYDVNSGNAFSTYATFWIVQRITRAIDDQGATIRIPIWRAQETRRQKRETGATGVVPRAAYVPLPYCISLDAPQDPWGDHPEDSTLGAQLADTMATGEAGGQTHEDATVVRLSDHAALYLALEHLSLRERYVIELRFGLSNDGEGMTLEGIGAQMQITRERVRQIEQRAIRVLRACLVELPEGDVLVSQLIDWRVAQIRRNHAHARTRMNAAIKPIVPCVVVNSQAIGRKQTARAG